MNSDIVQKKVKETAEEAAQGEAEPDITELNSEKKAPQSVKEGSYLPENEAEVIAKLKKVDMNRITLIDAMNILYELKSKL